MSGGGGGHSTEAQFALLPEPSWVRISVLTFSRVAPSAARAVEPSIKSAMVVIKTDHLTFYDTKIRFDGR